MRTPPGRWPAIFKLTALNANAGVRGLEMEGKRLGDLTATAYHGGTGDPVQRELGFRRLHDQVTAVRC